MKSILLPSLLSLCILSSCKSEKPETARLYVETMNQNYCNDLSNMGWEMKYYFMEVSEDKSFPQMQNKYSRYLKFLNQIDSLTVVSLNSLNDMKIKLLKDAGLSKIIKKAKKYPNDDLRTPFYDLKWAKSDYRSDILNDEANHTDLTTMITKYKQDLARIIVQSSSQHETNFYFDPPVANIRNLSDLDSLLEKSFSTNNVSPDDTESLKTLYEELTFDSDFRKMINRKQDWLTAFGILTQLQTNILRARFLGFRVLGSRWCIAEYSFNQIAPLAYGKEVISKNAIAEFEVFYAAFDSNRNPLVKTDQGIITRTENGKAHICVSSLRPGKNIIRGSITVMNKSGIPKTQKWEKEIFVTD